MQDIKISVTADCFEDIDRDSVTSQTDDGDDTIHGFKYEEYFAYKKEIPKYVKDGYITVFSKPVAFGLIEIINCIMSGDRGDDDGYGVEPDTWIQGYLDSEFKFVSPFSLGSSKSNRNIMNLLKAGINPVDDDCKIKICPYDKVEPTYLLPGYLVVELQGNYGLTDKKLNVLIPLEYAYLNVDINGLARVELHNRFFGVLDLENHFVIPPIYEDLYYINEGRNKGNYEAKINGLSVIIDPNNQIIS